jgi:hypothetical protein
MATRNAPKLVRRVRAACAAIAVVAFLVFLNMNQMEDSREDLLYSVGVINTMAPQVLVMRRSEAITNAWVEYGALVSAALGVALAVAAPKLLRANHSPISS